MKKSALITGINGQDGSYLAELLLEKGYFVHGLIRNSSSISNVHTLNLEGKITLHEGDLSDYSSLKQVIEKSNPTEVYNLGAVSNEKASFDIPEYTAEVNGVGVLRLLEVIRFYNPKIKFFQASTSELYGNIKEAPQSESTPFYIRSPYGAAKLYAYWIVVNYREVYGIHACNGILFNHESPRRGETFVSRKISLAVAKIALGLQEKLVLGNLDAKRDWGFAKDFVEGMWLMLQQSKAEDFVLATGKATPVREFVSMAFSEVGLKISWQGEGIEEKGIDQNGNVRVEISPAFFRPAEIDLLVGNANKAKNMLGWAPRTSLKDLVKIMIGSDLKLISKQLICS